jgi:hypothetical protein
MSKKGLKHIQGISKKPEPYPSLKEKIMIFIVVFMLGLTVILAILHGMSV